MPSSHESDARDRGDPAGAGVSAPEAEERRAGGEHPDQPDTDDRVAELAAELARAEDRYRRALADLDNYRKRAGREIERRVAEGRESFLRDWLEPIDSVERALRMDPDNPLLAGMRSVHDQMQSILARSGVQRIGEAGERFDPERHEAIDVRLSDAVPDYTVVDVRRAGFAIGDRVLRPAQVVVARHPARPS
jgi:molecular chaperone GrpE